MANQSQRAFISLDEDRRGRGSLQSFISSRKRSKRLVSVDMDGTVADISPRRELALQFGSDGSRAFYNALLDGSKYHMDLPIVASRDFLTEYVTQTGGEVVYLSGRRQGSEHFSEAWLEQHGFPKGRILHRPIGQRSLEFKVGWLRRLKAEGPWIDGHFGDRLEDDGGAARLSGVTFVHIDNNVWPTFTAWDAHNRCTHL